MTFNVRNGQCNDGADSWEHRKSATVQAILRGQAAVTAVQEAFDFQMQYLASELPSYAWVGCGRDDGACEGEYAGVFYDKRRFRCLDKGWFWLSPTPERPTLGWGARFNRIVTWVELLDQSGRILIANTHWDHESEEARIQSARLLARFVREREMKTLVLGDFNCLRGSAPHQALTAGGLSDACRAGGIDAALATYHAFRGVQQGPQIDWILHTPDLHMLRAWIDQDRIDGRWPSDHYPLLAEIQ